MKSFLLFLALLLPLNNKAWEAGFEDMGAFKQKFFSYVVMLLPNMADQITQVMMQNYHEVDDENIDAFLNDQSMISFSTGYIDGLFALINIYFIPEQSGVEIRVE